ncbi:hypothetical protein Tco_1511752, partial [Tanacetum coccineum]
GKSFSGNVTLLFPSMLAQPTEDEGTVSEDHLKPNQHHLLLTQVQTTMRHSLTHLPDLHLLFLFLIPFQRVLAGIIEVTTQAAQIKYLKSQIKQLMKKAKPGKKSAKSTLTAHTDQVFDDVDVNDAIDYIKTDAYMQKGVSTEDQVSTVKPNKDESTAPTTVFRDDETIAEFLVSMSQNKAKQKGVEIKDTEDSDRPRATSTRSVLTLKPLPRIDPKDKRKKVLKEEAESAAESEGVDEAKRKFNQLAKDEEIARNVQED